MAESTAAQKWLDVGRYSVLPWSIAGVESCIVVQGKNDKLNVAFDLGNALREAVRCEHVFISHGHVDHTAGIVQHASRRDLYSLPRATYHVPPHLVEPLRDLAAAAGKVHGADSGFTDLKLNPVTDQETVKLPGGYFVRAFPTHHRVSSQGYILYKRNRKLKAEFLGLPSQEIGQLVREGVQIHDEVITPEIAYTGDTTFQVFTSPSNPDLLRANIIISEATYIDSAASDNTNGPTRLNNSIAKARERGHCHLHEYIEHAHLFNDVEHVVLVHMSDKYSRGFIERTMQEALPESLQDKVHVGTYMKEVTSS